MNMMEFFEVSAGVLKAGCKVILLLIAFVILAYTLIQIVKALIEAGKEGNGEE